MTRGDDIRECVRVGARASTELITVHVAVDGTEQPPRVAFAVGKGVGGSVVRNRVQRRLRHQVLASLGQLPGGSRIVVRASPAAAGASSLELGRDLGQALARAARKAVGGR